MIHLSLNMEKLWNHIGEGLVKLSKLFSKDRVETPDWVWYSWSMSTRKHEHGFSLNKVKNAQVVLHYLFIPYPHLFYSIIRSRLITFVSPKHDTLQDDLLGCTPSWCCNGCNALLDHWHCIQNLSLIHPVPDPKKIIWPTIRLLYIKY